MGLPGLQRLDHVGFTVPDLDEAHAFLVDVIGWEYLYSLGPFRDDGDWMAEHLNGHPRATVPENRFYRLGGPAILEGFSYTAPDQRTQPPRDSDIGGRRGSPTAAHPAAAGPPPPRNSDIGGHHVALYVDALDAAIAYLRAHGVTVCGAATASRGPHECQRWVYFLSPWGMQFELVSYPHGRAFYRDEAS